jgi:hypothetical protein
VNKPKRYSKQFEVERLLANPFGVERLARRLVPPESRDCGTEAEALREGGLSACSRRLSELDVFLYKQKRPAGRFRLGFELTKLNKPA